MLTLITGKVGSGKTYYLAKVAFESLLKGIDVYSNVRFNIKPEYNFKGKYTYWQDFSELIAVRHGLIIMDEAQIYLNARKWLTLPEDFQHKIAQHRHHQLNLLGATQNFFRVDISMRENVDEYLEGHKIGSSEGKNGELPKKIWGVFYTVRFDPLDAKAKRREYLSLNMFFMRRKICDFYDTHGSVGRSLDTSEYVNIKARVCSKCGHKKIMWK